MIASLPMYDRVQSAAALDRLWAQVRGALGAPQVPLTRGGDLWSVWTSPALLLSQTCGYPFRAKLAGRVALVGAGDHRLPGCPPGHYHSVFVAARAGRLTDFAGTRFAYNDALSQSGWAGPMVHAETAGVAFSSFLKTGAHRDSARAVADGRADIAAIDAVTWQMIRNWDDFAAPLFEVDRTPPSPALPFISARSNDAPAIFDALKSAIGGLSDDDREVLRLYDLVPMTVDQYLSVETPPPPPVCA